MITRVTPTADDYAWFDERFPELAEAYCLTLVRGVPPTEVLRRLGAAEEVRVTGAAGLMDPAFAGWDEHNGGRLFVGATTAGDWTVAVEPNGFLGVTEAAIVPLSQGTRLVAHFRNVNAVDYFYWVENATIRLNFEPLFAYRRDGTDPDGVVDVMEQIGFHVRPGQQGEFDQCTEAAFALAEYLTGVRLTAELFESATFVCGTAPTPTG